MVPAPPPSPPREPSRRDSDLTARRPANWPRVRRVLCAAVASLGVLSVVTWTVAPSVTFGDSGELLSAAISLGVGHPPGYPLWTLVAHGLIRLHAFATPGCAANLLSALALGVAGLCSFLAFRDLCEDDLAALLGALVLCFAPLVWDTATTADVYTWDLALLALGLLTFSRFLRHACEATAGGAGQAALLGLVLGAGIAHRPTHVLFQLGYLATLLLVPRANWLSARRVSWFLAGLVVSLCVWLYLPLRGGAWPGLPHGLGTPTYQFDTITTFGAFLDCVSCKRYRHYVWGAAPHLWGTVLAFDIRMLSRQWSVLWWGLAVVGLWGARQAGLRALPIAIVTLLGAGLFWNYAVIDPESFLQPFLFGAAGLVAVGTATVARWSRLPTVRWQRGACAGLLWTTISALLLVSVVRTYREVDRSRDLLAQEYADEVLSEVGDRSCDIIVGWDNSICSDHRVFPLRHAAWAFDRGWGVWIWSMPQESDASWSDLLARLEIPEAERQRLLAVHADTRSRELVRLCAERPNAFSAGSSWPTYGGGYTEALGWVSRPRTTPPEGTVDPATVERWFAWAEHCLAVRPGDRVVRAMAFAPIIELAGDLTGRGRAAEADALLRRAAQRDPANLPVRFALAESLLARGSSEVALEQLHAARGLAECFADWHDVTTRIGRELHREGRWAEAIPYLRVTIGRRGDPTLVDRGRCAYDRSLLAECYRRVGRERDADRVWQPVAAR